MTHRSFSPIPLVLAFLTTMFAIAELSASPIRGACNGSADHIPRIAVFSAFSNETDRIIDEMHRNDRENSFDGCVVINGYRFAKGRLRGKDVVAVLTNASIINAAMVTQLALDRFTISHVIFSGIAGGVGGLGANDGDPTTPNESPLGSVVIPRRWGFHQEMYFNDTDQTVPCPAVFGLRLNYDLQPMTAVAKTCAVELGGEGDRGAADKGALFVPDAKYAFLRDTNVTSARVPQYYRDADDDQRLRSVPVPPNAGDSARDQQLLFWFGVDEQLFDTARRLDVALLECIRDVSSGTCVDEPIDPPPRLIVGQNGVTGPTFVDNARYREYVSRTLNFDEAGARNDDTDVLVLDMETAAAAMVAHSNGTPFIGVRGVSDLAGGGGGNAASELKTFFDVAAKNQAQVVFALIAGIDLR